MPKATTQFVCAECGYTSPKWLGRCPDCGKFNTLVEELIAPTLTSSKKQTMRTAVSRALPLSQVKYEKYERVSSGIAELDVVLGGGIVRGSLVLVGGDPGVGKSTLLTQVAAHLSKEHTVLYLSAEESCSQVKLRCERLGLNSDTLLLLNETNLENAEESILGAEYVIVDSVQAIYTDALTSAAGSVGQVRECAARLMRIAKSRGITFFLVGHVTKEGTLAGPKVLEHIMDAVLYFEGERTENFKILRAVKNRFGSVQEVGVFEMTDAGIFGVTDYSGLFLSDTRGEAAGAAVTPSETGNRCMMVEIQTLMCRTAYGLPRRMSLGVDFNRLVVLVAVLEKRCGLPLGTQDIYLNAMGGIRLSEPSADLAVCAALASAEKMTPVDKFTAVFGEVGLTGEVRGVGYADKRVNECIKMGFRRVILPEKNKKACEKFAGKIELVPVRYVSEMIRALFPQNAEK
ncbi:MAG TPA: DNA repair protein RadA [Candidatus Gallimonas intestinigallinarum]|uniref:DNA repair protein RadA n=1 Tax=Candidatus Gallimonas intestinigallinarum TaxID=2838604 RepID=A0A9D2DY94_9FIRM|nr:DNA repair protein RadA [Candidatus Gallimonas intestinigallinarum]